MTRETYTKEIGSTKEIKLSQLQIKALFFPLKKKLMPVYSQIERHSKRFLLSKLMSILKFPDNIHQGFRLYGFVPKSVKQGLQIRRIQTIVDNQVWQIKPTEVMPYMTMDIDTAQKILVKMGTSLGFKSGI